MSGTETKKLVIENSAELKEYLEKMNNYTDKVIRKEIKPEESLNSLIKSGICNEDRVLNKAYREELV